MNVMSPGRHSPRYLQRWARDNTEIVCFISDWEQAAHFERVDTIRTADGQMYSTLPGASYIRFRGPGRHDLVIKRGLKNFRMPPPPRARERPHRASPRPAGRLPCFLPGPARRHAARLPSPAPVIAPRSRAKIPRMARTDQSIISVASAAAHRCYRMTTAGGGVVPRDGVARGVARVAENVALSGIGRPIHPDSFSQN